MSNDDSRLIPAWRILVTLSATIAAMLMPLQLIFREEFANDVEILDWLLTLVLSVDVVVNFRTSGWRKTSTQTETASFGARVLLATDILAAIPFHAVVGLPVFHLFRLLKLARVSAYMSDWHRTHSESWSIMRLGFFTYWMVVSVNWLACGWLSLRGVNLQTSMWSNYVHALYWCIQTLTTVGYGDELPATDVERIYAMGLMIVGVGVYGYVIGNVASILANIDPAKAEYRSMMERLTGFMKYRRIPPDLQRRIRGYYSYLWEKRLGYDESTIISALPSSLQTDVSLFLKKDIIEKVPIFKGASEEFIRDIALQMRSVVYTPGDYVVRAGDAGRDMYFISRGTLEVVAKDGTTVYTMLRDGDFFGEIALLLNQPRSASVRAVDYCDLYRLEKDHFDRVLARYPDFAAHIQTMTKERQERGM
jgi:voltage-gated potassium channel